MAVVRDAAGMLVYNWNCTSGHRFRIDTVFYMDVNKGSLQDALEPFTF